MKKLMLIGFLAISAAGLAIGVSFGEEQNIAQISPQHLQSNFVISPADGADGTVKKLRVLLKDHLLIAVETTGGEKIWNKEEPVKNMWRQISSPAVKVMYFYSW